MEAALGARRGKAPRPPSAPRRRRTRASAMDAGWPRRRPAGGSGRSPTARSGGDASVQSRRAAASANASAVEPPGLVQDSGLPKAHKHRCVPATLAPTIQNGECCVSVQSVKRYIRKLEGQKSFEAQMGKSLTTHGFALLLLLVVSTATIACGQGLHVSLWKVDISGQAVDAQYLACGNPNFAGPFISGSDAVDWKNQFASGAPIVAYLNTDPDACTFPILSLENGTWTRS